MDKMARDSELGGSSALQALLGASGTKEALAIKRQLNAAYWAFCYRLNETLWELPFEFSGQPTAPAPGACLLRRWSGALRRLRFSVDGLIESDLHYLPRGVGLMSGGGGVDQN